MIVNDEAVEFWEKILYTAEEMPLDIKDEILFYKQSKGLSDSDVFDEFVFYSCYCFATRGFIGENIFTQIASEPKLSIFRSIHILTFLLSKEGKEQSRYFNAFNHVVSTGEHVPNMDIVVNIVGYHIHVCKADEKTYTKLCHNIFASQNRSFILKGVLDIVRYSSLGDDIINTKIIQCLKSYCIALNSVIAYEGDKDKLIAEIYENTHPYTVIVDNSDITYSESFDNILKLYDETLLHFTNRLKVENDKHTLRKMKPFVVDGLIRVLHESSNSNELNYFKLI